MTTLAACGPQRWTRWPNWGRMAAPVSAPTALVWCPTRSRTSGSLLSGRWRGWRLIRAREIGVLAVLLVEDQARDVRRAAAHALGAMQDHRVAELLLPGLEDRDALVRAAVLHELEHLLTKADVARRLCDELESERADRRRACLYALARLDVRVGEAAVSRAASDPDPDVA